MSETVTVTAAPVTVKYTGDNVKSVKVGEKTIEAGLVGTKVPVGDGQAVEIEAADGYVITEVDGINESPTGLNTAKVTGTVDITADAEVTIAITTAEATIPYAKGSLGTVTYDEEGAASLFKTNSVGGGLESSVETSADDNKTKVEKWLAGDGHPRGGGYQPFLGTHVLTGSEVKISFDFKFSGIETYVSIQGNTNILSNRNGENAKGTGKVITFNGGTTDNNKLYVYTGTGDDATTCEEITGTTRDKWYHIETVSDVASTKQVAVKVYNYKANNNYANETPLLEKTYPFRDSAVDGISGFSVYTNQNKVNNYIDNLYINDATFDGIFVTTDGNATVNKDVTAAGETVEITPVAKNGQKVKSLTVNGATDNLAESGGKYTYTVQEGDEAVDVKVVYTRSDVKSIEVDGISTVKRGEAEAPNTVTYTATVKDTKDYTFTNEDGVEVEWELRDESGASVTPVAGVTLTEDPDNQLQATLSVSNDLAAATKVTVTAKVATDIDVPAAYTEGKKTVSLVTENVYNILATNVTPEDGAGGTVHVNVKNGDPDVSQITESATLQVVAAPSAGYEVKSVQYATKTESGTKKDINNAGGNNYEVNMNTINDDITIYVVFDKTKNTITLDPGAQNVKVRVNGTETETAVIGDTVTIIPEEQNKKVTAITVEKTDASGEPVTATGNSFVMPGYSVTVKTATVDNLLSATYASQDFNSFDDLAALTSSFGTFDESTGRLGTKTIETIESSSDKYLKVAIESSSGNRSKDILTPTKIDLTTSDTAKIAFDVNLHPITTNRGYNTYAELSLVNSDKQVLFAIRSQDKSSAPDGKAAVYAGLGYNNKTDNGTDPTIGSGNADPTAAWGNNEYMFKKLPTTPLTQEADQLAMAVDTWYHVELTLKDNKMTVSVKQKDGADAYTAELDISGLKKDIARIGFFNDNGRKTGAGTYIAIDNIAVTETTYVAD